MARTEPAAKVASLANWDTAQMRTHTQHDKPFWSLNAFRIRLWVAKFGYFDRLSLVDFFGRAVADEDGFASPFDNDL